MTARELLPELYDSSPAASIVPPIAKSPLSDPRVREGAMAVKEAEVSYSHPVDGLVSSIPTGRDAMTDSRLNETAIARAKFQKELGLVRHRCWLSERQSGESSSGWPSCRSALLLLCCWSGLLLCFCCVSKALWFFGNGAIAS